MEKIAILILAAGASSRMGGADKLLQEVEDKPLLQVICARAMATGMPVFIALPGPDHPRARLVGDARPVWVPEAAEGMAASIRRGVAALPNEMAAVMILPADMPEISQADLERMQTAFRGAAAGAILRATDETGRAGHPVIFPRDHFDELLGLKGDSGARAILAEHAARVELIGLPGRHATIDLDTPEDWADWRGGKLR